MTDKRKGKARRAALQAENKRLRKRFARLADRLDSLSEMGEMESLSLQMAMDRVSKLMSTLSNLLRKMAETQAAIVRAMK